MVMPIISSIPNKVQTNLSIDKEKLEEAKEKGVNISLLLDAALERELHVTNKQAFGQAMERQNKTYKDFIDENQLNNKFEEYKYEDVVEEKPKQQNRSFVRSDSGI